MFFTRSFFFFLVLTTGFRIILVYIYVVWKYSVVLYTIKGPFTTYEFYFYDLWIFIDFDFYGHWNRYPNNGIEQVVVERRSPGRWSPLSESLKDVFYVGFHRQTYWRNLSRNLFHNWKRFNIVIEYSSLGI